MILKYSCDTYYSANKHTSNVNKSLINPIKLGTGA